MINLSQYAYSILKRMYDKCNDQSDSGDLLISLMKKNANQRNEALSTSSEDSTYIDSETKHELVDGGYVVQKQNTTQLMITAKGIWEVMFREYDYTVEQLIDGIQELYFKDMAETKISASNRIALFSIICMRCYSQECCVDVKIQSISKKWWDVFLLVNDFLIKMGVVEEKYSIRNEKKTKNDSEDPACNLIRHSDRVPRFTNQIFRKGKNLEYWVDVLDKNGNIDESRLALLIKMTLGNSIDDTNYSRYSDFANDLCLDMGYLFESSFEDTHYLSSSQDDIIGRAFEHAAAIDL